VKRGVIAYSTGNHAQAVAKAAADAGTTSTIVMSPDVPEEKVDATKSWGASVVMAESNSYARRAMAERLAHETGATLIPPYNDLDVMAGQGTIAFELASQLDRLSEAIVYVPIGGGGLIAGVASALKAIEPKCRVIGVEPEWEADAVASFRAGRIVAAEGPSQSIADAIKVQALGELTFPIIQAFVDDIVTVTETEIARSTVELFEKHRLVVEPSGAISFAAATRAGVAPEARKVAILCGGNISIERLHELRHASR
jgi:threonine dehydratase